LNDAIRHHRTILRRHAIVVEGAGRQAFDEMRPFLDTEPLGEDLLTQRVHKEA
jgi:hypothetical protein